VVGEVALPPRLVATFGTAVHDHVTNRAVARYSELQGRYCQIITEVL
jgi:hypothetical protein